MIKDVDDTLVQIGFLHPLHPAMANLPMGMVMGSFLFTISHAAFGKPNLLLTEHHCILLALVGALPTGFLGYMGWQYVLKGACNNLILSNYFLFALYIFLLLLTFIAGRNDNRPHTKYLIWEYTTSGQRFQAWLFNAGLRNC